MHAESVANFVMILAHQDLLAAGVAFADVADSSLNRRELHELVIEFVGHGFLVKLIASGSLGEQFQAVGFAK
jgi:hypothetical protein